MSIPLASILARWLLHAAGLALAGTLPLAAAVAAAIPCRRCRRPISPASATT